MRALVTGLGNLGKACVPQLLRDNWETVVISRSPLPSGDSEYHIKRLLEFHQLNLCLDLDIANWLESQEPFDLVVMTHGVQQPCELGKADTVDVFHSVMDGNLTSAFYLTNELIRQDKLNEGALVVYCSSIQATQVRKGRGCYAIAKAGLEALARTVSVEGSRYGVRGVALRLGQLDKLMARVSIPPEQMKAIEDRLLAPLVPGEDVARLILELYSQRSLIGTIDFDSGHHLSVWP